VRYHEFLGLTTFPSEPVLSTSCVFGFTLALADTTAVGSQPRPLEPHYLQGSHRILTASLYPSPAPYCTVRAVVPSHLDHTSTITASFRFRPDTKEVMSPLAVTEELPALRSYVIQLAIVFSPKPQVVRNAGQSSLSRHELLAIPDSAQILAFQGRQHMTLASPSSLRASRPDISVSLETKAQAPLLCGLLQRLAGAIKLWAMSTSEGPPGLRGSAPDL
jgi:hypothetical protein